MSAFVSNGCVADVFMCHGIQIRDVDGFVGIFVYGVDSSAI